MKKLIALGCASLIAAAFAVPSATAAPKQQVVEGSIEAPAWFYGQATGTDGCFSGGHRRLDTASQGNFPNGVIAYKFEVDKATWNKPFVLEALEGGQGVVDLDMNFYLHYPTIDEWPNDPQNAGTPVSIDFNTRQAGGEAGKVPKDTTVALVCLYMNVSTQQYGAQADFKYTAGKGVKLPKS